MLLGVGWWSRLAILQEKWAQAVDMILGPMASQQAARKAGDSLTSSKPTNTGGRANPWQQLAEARAHWAATHDPKSTLTRLPRRVAAREECVLRVRECVEAQGVGSQIMSCHVMSCHVMSCGLVLTRCLLEQALCRFGNTAFKRAFQAIPCVCFFTLLHSACFSSMTTKACQL